MVRIKGFEKPLPKTLCFKTMSRAGQELRYEGVGEKVSRSAAL
jgi:hypothetical protein